VDRNGDASSFGIVDDREGQKGVVVDFRDEDVGVVIFGGDAEEENAGDKINNGDFVDVIPILILPRCAIRPFLDGGGGVGASTKRSDSNEDEADGVASQCGVTSRDRAGDTPSSSSSSSSSSFFRRQRG
jgi:hypothetical protein